MNSSVVQMFHCRLALFHAAQCCGQGSQLDGFPFWSIHPLSCLRIKRDLRNGGTKAWTHPTQKWNWFSCPLWSMTWQNKTQICSPSLSHSSEWASWIWESGVSLHLQVRQRRWGRSLQQSCWWGRATIITTFLWSWVCPRPALLWTRGGNATP